MSVERSAVIPEPELTPGAELLAAGKMLAKDWSGISTCLIALPRRGATPSWFSASRNMSLSMLPLSKPTTEAD